MRYMLDTNLLIELLRGNADRLLVRLDKQRGNLAVSAVTVSELDYGAAHATDPGAMTADLDAMLGLVQVAPFDRDAARWAGHVRHRLATEGKSIGPYDTLIAGHALALDVTLVTHNTREFGRIPELALEDWQAEDR